MSRQLRIVLSVISLASLVSCEGNKPQATIVPEAQSAGAAMQSAAAPEPLVDVYGPMPTGVAVSHEGRLFVNFPRWGDPVRFSVVEIIGGQITPFPNEAMNQLDLDRPGDHLVSVQSVVIDPADRLWILDTGSINFQPVISGGPKLVCVDLKSNLVVKIIHFPANVALPASYLNDVRFDLRRGNQGMAFITDSTDKGVNGIIVVDLGTGESWRRLNNHPSTKAEKNFVPRNDPAMNLRAGCDGIAISADGQRLFYCPLAGRHLYSVSVDALVDQKRSDRQVGETVLDLGDKGFASDGLESDAADRLYLTDYENSAIHVRNPDGTYATLAQGALLRWPDSLSMGSDGYLYVTANQLDLQPRFHNGQDLRRQPYHLFRIKTDGSPITQRIQSVGETTEARRHGVAFGISRRGAEAQRCRVGCWGDWN
jgi:sugar lactone lactonase YvrE